jgi:hypothetical protein
MYCLDVELNAAATEARFRIFEGLNPDPVYDELLGATLSGERFGVAVSAWMPEPNGATEIITLSRIGLGTVAGFLRSGA